MQRWPCQHGGQKSFARVLLERRLNVPGLWRIFGSDCRHFRRQKGPMAEGCPSHLVNLEAERAVLGVLLGAPDRILSRDQLLDMSRLHNDEVYNRSVDVQIMRLRRKIEPNPGEPRYIRTERGAGYVFGVPVETVY